VHALHELGRRVSQKILYPPARFVGRLGLGPTAFTLLGLALAVAAGVAFAGGRLRTAAILVLAAGVADMVDGAVARANERGSAFGAFLDSVMDRYSEAAYLTGLIYFYAAGGEKWRALLTVFVLTGSLLVSYTKARAESLVADFKAGILERPERVMLLALGFLVGGYGALVALWVLAVLSHATAIQRIWYTRAKLKLSRRDR
jgi:CDP-diacylglycerol--glycerol-3-phosphate 3-phosphatidyltransferase